MDWQRSDNGGVNEHNADIFEGFFNASLQRATCQCFNRAGGIAPVVMIEPKVSLVR